MAHDESGGPFAEHPSGDFDTALEAMAEAIRRFWEIEERDRWITVCAQGMGAHEDAYHIEEVRLRGATIDLGEHHVDEGAVLAVTGLIRRGVTAHREGARITLSAVSPEQLAVFLDALFRTQLGIRGWPDQDDDYAVGFEW